MISFSAALLVGGRSRRMGDDKAFLDWQGQPLWRVQIEKLLALNPEAVYIAARKEQGFEAVVLADPHLRVMRQLQIIEDPESEDCGPLGAILRSLRRAQMPLLVLAVDMPKMTADFLRDHLLGAARPGRGVAFTGRHGNETLGALYVPEMLPRMEEAMQEKAYSLQTLLSQLATDGLCDLKPIEDAQALCLSNVNTPEEARRILRFQA